MIKKQAKSRIAFTLAEVLVTLAIVGVVAATCIPALMNYTNDIELKNSFKKEYAVFNQATNQILADNGGNLKGVVGVGDTNQLISLYLPYLNTTKVCPATTVWAKHVFGNCFLNQALTVEPWAHWIDGSNNTQYNVSQYWTGGFVLADGAMVSIIDGSYEPTYMRCETISQAAQAGDGYGMCSEIWIDVNGFKGPNRQGKDLLNMEIYQDGLKPKGWNKANGNATCGGTGTASNGQWCPAVILRGS